METPDSKIGLSAKEVRQFIKRLATESERAAVIIGASRVDVGIERLLKKVMHNSPAGADPLFDSDRVLGTFSARVAVSYRLCLIDSEFKSACTIVRQLRNDFAHTIEFAKLTSRPHRDRVAQLVTLTKDHIGFDLTMGNLDCKAGDSHLTDFCGAIACLVGQLEIAAHDAEPLPVNTCANFKDWA